MFLELLLASVLLSALLSFAVERAFRRSIATLLERIVGPALAVTWLRYVRFAIYVVGVSGGVRFWELEKYIAGTDADGNPLVLDADRWALELYKAAIGTLQSVAWMLFVLFLFALIAYVLVRGFEGRRRADRGSHDEPPTRTGQ